MIFRYLPILAVVIFGLFLFVMSDYSSEVPEKLPPTEAAPIILDSAAFDEPVILNQQIVSQVDLPIITNTSNQSFIFYPELAQIRRLEDEGLLTSEFVSQIQTLLTATDPVIRLASVESIAEINHLDSIPALVDALNDPEPVVRIAAIEGLAMQPDENVSMYIEPMLFDWDNAVKVVAIDALADLENVHVAPILASLLSDYDPTIRSQVVNALVDLGGELTDANILDLNNGAYQVNH